MPMDTNFIILKYFFYHFRVKEKRKKKRGVDYNAEIPFEKKPAPGKKAASLGDLLLTYLEKSQAICSRSMRNYSLP